MSQRGSVSYQALLGELDLVLLLEVPRLSLAFETFVNQCKADRPAEWAANEGIQFVMLKGSESSHIHCQRLFMARVNPLLKIAPAPAGEHALKA